MILQEKCVWNGITDCEFEGILGKEACLECLANRVCKLEAKS